LQTYSRYRCSPRHVLLPGCGNNQPSFGLRIGNGKFPDAPERHMSQKRAVDQRGHVAPRLGAQRTGTQPDRRDCAVPAKLNAAETDVADVHLSVTGHWPSPPRSPVKATLARAARLTAFSANCQQPTVHTSGVPAVWWGAVHRRSARALCWRRPQRTSGRHPWPCVPHDRPHRNCPWGQSRISANRLPRGLPCI
jgi:hypothetical protein